MSWNNPAESSRTGEERAPNNVTQEQARQYDDDNETNHPYMIVDKNPQVPMKVMVPIEQLEQMEGFCPLGSFNGVGFKCKTPGNTYDKRATICAKCRGEGTEEDIEFLNGIYNSLGGDRTHIMREAIFQVAESAFPYHRVQYPVPWYKT